MATILCRLLTTFSFLVATSLALAQERVLFEDEFDDPATFACDWEVVPCRAPGDAVMAVENGDLVIREMGGPEVAGAGFQARQRFDGAVSIHAQVKFDDADWMLVARGDCEGPFHGALGALYSSGRVRLTLWFGGNIVQDKNVNLPDFDPEADYVLRLDSAGNQVEFRVWREGDDEPVRPIVQAVAAQPESAPVGVLVDSGASRLRWLRVSAPPEPSFCRGDVNGDEALDISDALFILEGLFLGGPRPPEVFEGCDS